MQCRKCGTETGSSGQSLCALCASGAPRSMTNSKPALYNSTASQLAASSSSASPQSEPTVKRTEPQPRVSQQDLNSGSGGDNIFALFGLVFAFFQPLLGIILSVIGLCKAKDSGNGKGIALAGLIFSILMTIAAAASYFIILKLISLT